MGIIAFSLVAVPPVSAKPPEGKGNPHQGQKEGKPGKGNQGRKGGKGGYDTASSGSLIYAGITFAEARDLAVHHRLVGYSALPPGIQKNLARGKPLPPGIAKKMVPSDMLVRLPVHPGYEWRIAGRDLILVAVGTLIIADILHDVFD